MDDLALTYDLKEGSVGAPIIYLRAEIKKYQVGNGNSLTNASINREIEKTHVPEDTQKGGTG